MENNQKIIIYTDGSAIDNGKSDRESSCGWAYKIIYDDGNVQKNSGGCAGKTNNQMEMLAVLNALRAIPDKSVSIELYSDSEYVVKTENGIYGIHENKELWAELKEETGKFKDISFNWVKGHDKNEHNNEVDDMAQQAAQKIKNQK